MVRAGQAYGSTTKNLSGTIKLTLVLSLCLTPIIMLHDNINELLLPVAMLWYCRLFRSEVAVLLKLSVFDIMRFDDW